MLLSAGADPNIADADGITPLMHAVFSDQVELCVCLTSVSALLFALALHAEIRNAACMCPQSAVNNSYSPLTFGSIITMGRLLPT
jgi:ankyrin repeat protein